MKDEKLITTRRLRLNDAIYYKTLLEYVPEEWNINSILNKKVTELSMLDLERVMMVKKHYNSIVLLSIAIEKMKNEKLESLMIDIDEYKEIMNFSLEEIKNMKFKDNTEYMQYMLSVKCNIPNHSVLNEGVNIYSKSDNLSGIKSKSQFKKHFNRGKRF